MPRKNKDFSRQQKSAITRIYNKYKVFIEYDDKEKVTFLQYKKGDKLENIDGERTNKGIFYKYPGAKLVKLPKGDKKVTSVSISYNHLKEIFLPFPNHLMSSIDLIKDYVEKLEKKYKPDYVMWSVYGNRSTMYDVEAFNFYVIQLSNKSGFTQELLEKTFFNGVYFGWEPKR